MSDRIESQKIAAAEFDDELYDEDLDRQEAAPSVVCAYTSSR